MTYKEEGSKAAKGKRSSSVSTTLSVRASTKHGLRKKCSNRMTTTPEEADAPVQFVFTSDGVVRREDRPPSDCASPSPKGMDLFMPDILNDKTSLPFSPGVAFTEEERRRVQQLVGLDQTILISFNDLEEEVAVKVVMVTCLEVFMIEILYPLRFSMRCMRKQSPSKQWTTSWCFGDTPLQSRNSPGLPRLDSQNILQSLGSRPTTRRSTSSPPATWRIRRSCCCRTWTPCSTSSPPSSSSGRPRWT